jgi:hypothetical protein
MFYSLCRLMGKGSGMRADGCLGCLAQRVDKDE